VGNINPFRYRGYYFDVETGFYYLNSRYYDPETGRFINADDISYLDPETLNGLNLFAYCGNNPVMALDPDGHAWWKWLIGALILVGLGIATVLTFGAAAPITGFAATVVVGAFTGAVVSAGVGLGVAALTGGDLSDAFMWGAITGGLAGAASAGLGAVAFASSKLATAALQIAGNMLISSTITAVQGAITNTFSWGDVATSAFFGAIAGAVGFGLSGTAWEKGVRSLIIGIGLGIAEGVADVLRVDLFTGVRQFFKKLPKVQYRINVFGKKRGAYAI
jgi:RHS repeat-associated protein